MCGIYGYVGTPVCVDQVVLGALRSMEYRGYDSWGTAFVSPDGQASVLKGVGRVPQQEAIGRDARTAIGHTRWATHGAVSERNAHPHLSPDGRVAVVHNGIIENADVLRSGLGPNVAYLSETDSELMAHLVSRELRHGLDLRRAVQNAFLSIEGTNAFLALDLVTEEIVAITYRLPIRIGRAWEHVALASDPVVFAGQTESIFALPDNVAVSLGRPGVAAESLLELERSAEPMRVPDAVCVKRDGPGASMRAEILEQPEVLRRLVCTPGAVAEAVDMAARARRIVLTGCGSAFHAAQFGADRLAYAGTSQVALAVPASEMAVRAGTLRDGDVVVALSQSGETADVIDAIGAAAERGARTIGMVNVAGSTVSRMVDVEVPLLAGTERSVLATKSFLAMLGRMTQLLNGLMRVGQNTSQEGTPVDMSMAADQVAATLTSREVATWIEELASALADRSSALVVGSGAHMAIAREAALKIKEGTYVHAEAIRAGELKHGVIALIDDSFPCLLLAGNQIEAKRQGIVAAELRSRGAAVFAMSAEEGTSHLPDDEWGMIQAGSPFAQTVICQQVALETALVRGLDPDYPRNLAKSVTVR